ncbi:o-succinylbenzoate--CoA ligase [Microlunatus ginsengisoli]|uniref:O-succinylbenzoate--CoA ligase n=2 Tax=Microlunatus ginsengisoli TaxID=363863 RepID=A0ABP6ZQD3_9ACTN
MAVMLVPVETGPPDGGRDSGLDAALGRALGGGAPVAPLPANPVERGAVLAMLAPDEPVEESDAVAVVATSGSTGRPKGVVLSRAAVAASATATHARLGGPGDWLAALPAHHVAGFMVRARALLAGTAIRDVGTDLVGLPAAVRGTRRPTYLSVVATQLTRALADPDLSAALARLDAVLLGGGPPPAGLLDRAAAAGLRIVTTYGMSETCGGCVYDGAPLDGVEVALGAGGAISIAGPTLFTSYRRRPDLTAAALAGGGLRTSDRGRWNDGRLQVLGRFDDVVISGGTNVDLAAVERAATRWATQRNAGIAVIGVPDPEWGTAVVAVTDAAERPGGLEDLRADLGRTLPPPALPRRLVHRGSIPRTAGGKIDRHRLRGELASAADPDNE